MNKELYNIRCELEKIPDRATTFENCVRKALSESVAQHSHYIDRICDYLKVRDSMKVLRQVKIHNTRKARKQKDDKTNR